MYLAIAQNAEKFYKSVTDKRFVFRIHELYNPIEKTNTPPKKCVEYLSRRFPKEDTKWQRANEKMLKIVSH